jgi:hypothetical protein
MILAMIARHTVPGTLEGGRQGYRVARSEFGEAVPPHAVDSALGAYRGPPTCRGGEGHRGDGAGTARRADLIAPPLRAVKSTPNE